MLLVACSNGTAENTERRDSQSTSIVSAPDAARSSAQFVVDNARLLDHATAQRIQRKLAALEKKTAHQFVVVTVTSLGGREVADFTTDLANAWGVGRAEQDDGVVLLVAPNERKVRIAVGYGLEHVLTDALCSRILEQKIIPHFREGNISRGIEAGVTALIGYLD